VPLVDFPLLDEMLRGRFFLQESTHWGRPLEPVDLDRFTPLGLLSVPLLAVAACDWNGYVRQAAIESLGRTEAVVALPFLVIRLNDWVPEVRAAAMAAVAPWMQPDRARELVTVLPLVARLEGQKRGSHAAFLASVRSLLGRPECQEALLECLAAPDRRVRRFALGVAVEVPGMELGRLFERALGDLDTSIRLWAARAVSSRPADLSLMPVIDLMVRDHFMPVRREALRWHLRQDGDARAAALEAALLDPHPSIAAEARYYLNESSPRDFAPFYRQALSFAEGGALVAALTGLGETGAAADAALLRPFIGNPVPRTRASALRAFAKVSPNTSPDIFLTALSDTSPRVSSMARRVFPKSGLPRARVHLTEVLERAEARHVRVNALRLLTRLDPWDALPLLVYAMAHSDPRVAQAAAYHLDRWFANSSRYYAAPTRAQLSAIDQAIQEHGELLTDARRKFLLFILKPFREPHGKIQN
jgi:HEAT repeat protein